VLTNADLGAALRRLRRDRKRTIEAVAFAADVHPTYLSGIERGVRNPTWAKLCALSKALDVSVASIAQGAEAERMWQPVFARPDGSWTPRPNAAEKLQRSNRRCPLSLGSTVAGEQMAWPLVGTRGH
jgi:transcriptional regulator with XRE-family HTH domain